MAYDRVYGEPVAVTADEYHAERALLGPTPQTRHTAPAPRPDEGRRVYTGFNDELLNVSFNEAGAFFTVNVRHETALLNLRQARDLAAVLSGTLSGWRADVHLTPRRQQ